jgi:hypothetical protein
MIKYLYTFILSLFLGLATNSLYAKSTLELDKECLGAAIYHEAGNQPLIGQYAVAEVVVNRIKAGFAPNACAVIHQHVGSHWQFGFNVGDHKIIPRSRVEYFYNVAETVLTEREAKVLPANILYFNNKDFISKEYELYCVIGAQKFFIKKVKKFKKQSEVGSLRGSHEILLHQNEMGKQEGLTAIHDDKELANLVSGGYLISIPTNVGLIVDKHLPMNRRYCRPWVARFLLDISEAYYNRFQKPLIVDSAVRTALVQRRLIRINRNAAAVTGDSASPHLMGIAVDINKNRFTDEELDWMRLYLLFNIHEGTIDTEEEFNQKCFHVSVYTNYLGIGFNEQK